MGAEKRRKGAEGRARRQWIAEKGKGIRGGKREEAGRAFNTSVEHISSRDSVGSKQDRGASFARSATEHRQRAMNALP